MHLENIVHELFFIHKGFTKFSGHHVFFWLMCFECNTFVFYVRFLKSTWGLEDSQKDTSSGKDANNIDLPSGDVQQGELTPAMDIFSAGLY